MIADVPVSLSLHGLDVSGDTPAETLRAQLEMARRSGCRAVQINGAAAGMRARELDRSARRDIAARLKREELGFSGVDLFLPPRHLELATHQDRAVAALIGAVELAGEIGSLFGGGRVVATELPERLAEDVRRTIAEGCLMHGVRLADCAWRAGIDAAGGPMGVGLDPAAVLAAGGDPAGEAARLGPGLVQGRLTDASAIGRVGAGRGRLDVLGYRIALSVAGVAGPVVLDLRGVPEQESAARAAVKAWTAAGLSP